MIPSPYKTDSRMVKKKNTNVDLYTNLFTWVFFNALLFSHGNTILTYITKLSSIKTETNSLYKTALNIIT